MKKWVYCYHYRRGREKTKRRAKEQQSGILLHPYTQANNTTQGPSNTVNEYNKKKHKTKAQRIDRSEAKRIG